MLKQKSKKLPAQCLSSRTDLAAFLLSQDFFSPEMYFLEKDFVDLNIICKNMDSREEKIWENDRSDDYLVCSVFVPR